MDGNVLLNEIKSSSRLNKFKIKGINTRLMVRNMLINTQLLITILKIYWLYKRASLPDSLG